MMDTIQEDIPTRKIWEDKFHHGKEIICVWLSQQSNKENIRNARYVTANFGGVLKIKYQQVAQVVNQSDDDWMKFIKSGSDGLTKTGQLLLQKAAEVYVYCILGAQAQNTLANSQCGCEVSTNTANFRKTCERHHHTGR